MNIVFAGIIGGWELVLILAVILVLFGAKKLPELARGLGSGIKEFKKATRDVSDELQSAMDLDAPQPQRRIPPAQPNYHPEAPPAESGTASTHPTNPSESTQRAG